MEGKKPAISGNKRQMVFMDWTLDLLIYIIILNLFAEYSTRFYFESFTITFFVAFVLKVLLVLILKLEHGVGKFFSKYTSSIMKFLRIMITWAILFLSKFLILEVLDIIFGERIEIYGFIPILILIIALIAARQIIVAIYKKL